MFAFVLLGSISSVLGQQIGWKMEEERFQNHPLCVECDVKSLPLLTVNADAVVQVDSATERDSWIASVNSTVATVTDAAKVLDEKASDC